MEGEQDLNATDETLGVEGEEVTKVPTGELGNVRGDDLPEDEQESQERELSPREALVEDMAERRREERGEPLSLEDVEEDDQKPENEDLGASEEDDTTTINVNGHELEVKTADVMAQGVRTLQKESAADARLEEANERTVEVDARERDLTERENKFNQGLATDEEIDADAGRFSEALVTNEGEAGEMFKKVLKDNRDLKATTAELISDGRESRQERVELQQRNHDDMVKHYYTEFKDIAVDPHLTTIFNAEASRVNQENPELGFQEVFKQAGTVVRERYMPQPEGKPKPPSPKTRKQNMQKQPKKAGGRVNLSTPAPKTQKPSEVIADMRKARGQG